MSKKILPFAKLLIRANATAAVMAPHPDDFDAIAITLKYLTEKGIKLKLAVLTGGASGVEDSFGVFDVANTKAALREAEQLASCRMFGLTDDAVTFLRLTESDSGELLDNCHNQQIIGNYLTATKAEVIFMPHGNDTNITHQLSLAMVKRAVAHLQLQVTFILNMDPKTIAITPNYYSGFGNDDAAWKGALLRCHRSQHQRNLNQRQHGFDYRIIEFNRVAALEFNLPERHAELFEVCKTVPHAAQRK